MTTPTKGQIFDLFYELAQVNRPGGTSKTRMVGRTVTCEEQEAMKKRIDGDIILTNYYTRLYNRDKNLAPPPRPTN